MITDRLLQQSAALTCCGVSSCDCHNNITIQAHLSYEHCQCARIVPQLKKEGQLRLHSSATILETDLRKCENVSLKTQFDKCRL